MSEIGALMKVQQRGLDPPQVPVVLPAIKPVARNGRGEVGSQRVGHDQRQKQITSEDEKVESCSLER
jgi:hypothetical protein